MCDQKLGIHYGLRSYKLLYPKLFCSFSVYYGGIKSIGLGVTSWYNWQNIIICLVLSRFSINFFFSCKTRTKTFIRYAREIGRDGNENTWWKHTAMTETHSRKGDKKSFQEKVTRKGYLVYYYTKVSNL